MFVFKLFSCKKSSDLKLRLIFENYMNYTKTEIHAKENRKRTVFFIKLIVFILLAVFSGNIIRYLEEMEPFIENFLNALAFFLAGNILISLARIITVRFYLRKKSHDPMRSNFV